MRLVRRIIQQLQRLPSGAWLVVLLGLVTIFFVNQRRELVRLTLVWRHADPRWLFVTLLLQLGILLVIAANLRTILARLGYPLPIRTLFRADLHRLLVSTVTPFGVAPGTYVFTQDLAQFGVPTEASLLSLGLYAALGYTSFVLLLIPALILLILDHALTPLMLSGVAALSLVAGTFIGGAALVLSGLPLPDRLVSMLPEEVRHLIDGLRSRRIRVRDLGLPFLFALTVDLTNVALLAACLRATGVHPPLLVALIGYQVGLLFAFVIPLFQGTGAVELSMTLALEQLGVPGAAALAASLLYRLHELWLPFALGLALRLGQDREVRRFVRHLPALVLFLTGLLSILVATTPHMIPPRLNRLSEYSLFEPQEFSRTFAVVLGFLLMYLAYQLWRRKRTAWLASLALLAGLIPIHGLRGGDPWISVLAGINIAILLWRHNDYHVRSDLPTLQRGLAFTVFSFAFALVYGALGFQLLGPRAFGEHFRFHEAIEQTLATYFGIGGRTIHPHTRYGAWFLDSLTVIGITTLAVAAFSLTRPVVWRYRTHPQERQRARQLIERYGNSSLDFFKWWPDKLFFFPSHGEAVIAYGVSLNTAVVLGDPVAATPADFDCVLDEFLDFCDANDWRVAFHQVPEIHLAAYRARGLEAIKIGEEAVLDLRSFSLRGARRKPLRWIVHRLEREGYHVVYYAPPHNDTLLAHLRAVSDTWLTGLNRRERSFTQGQFRDDYVRWTPIVAVESATGQIVAFVNLIPSGVPGQLTFDLMRRLPEPNGAMDFLLVKLIERAQAHGYTSLSLGLAPLAGVTPETGVDLTARAIQLFYTRLNRLFSFTGLREYKDKFDPVWEPRYLVYETELALPLIALAVVRLTESYDPRRAARFLPGEPLWDPFSLSVSSTAVSAQAPASSLS